MTEKWKTFPCKNCLLKNTCDIQCFKIPEFNVIREHLRENHLQRYCLNCGEVYGNYDYVIHGCTKCLPHKRQIIELKIEKMVLKCHK